MSDETNQIVTIVDRMESGIAILEVLETEITLEVPVSVLPGNAAEGTAIELNFKMKPEFEDDRRQEIQDMQDDLIE